MSMVDRCNVGRRKLLALLGSGAAATIGGAASIHGDTGPSGEPVSVAGDAAAHDPLSTRLTREYRRALSVRQRGNGVRVVPAAGDGGFQRRRYRRPR